MSLFHHSIHQNLQEICIEENSQAESSTQSSEATDGRSGSLTMIRCFSHGEGKTGPGTLGTIGVDDLFFGLMTIYSWTIGDLFFLLSVYFLCFCGDFLGLFLVPSVVFIAVFSHAGGILYTESKGFLRHAIIPARSDFRCRMDLFRKTTYLHMLPKKKLHMQHMRIDIHIFPFSLSLVGKLVEYLGIQGSCKSTNHHVISSKKSGISNLPKLGGIRQWKSMIFLYIYIYIFGRFPCNCAMFGLVI